MQLISSHPAVGAPGRRTRALNIDTSAGTNGITNSPIFAGSGSTHAIHAIPPTSTIYTGITPAAGNPRRFALSNPTIQLPANAPVAIAANCANRVLTIAPLATADIAAAALIAASSPASATRVGKHCSGMPTSSK
jgi:hypothetical protein